MSWHLAEVQTPGGVVAGLHGEEDSVGMETVALQRQGGWWRRIGIALGGLDVCGQCGGSGARTGARSSRRVEATIVELGEDAEGLAMVPGAKRIC